MKIEDIIRFLDEYAPPTLQESYDNAGLICGRKSNELTSCLVVLDTTEAVIEEAVQKGCNLVVAHHPIIFSGLKSLTGSNYVERVIMKAIKHDIAIYATHTNLDNVIDGVNKRFAEQLQLQNTRILKPKSNNLFKLTVFVPHQDSEKVLAAIHQSGAGQIGEYKNCAFTSKGTGTFTPTEEADPHIGQQGKAEFVEESRVEVIFPRHHKSQVLNAMRKSHPYEEVAYFLHELENENQETGSGMIGELAEPMDERNFLTYLKERMQLRLIRHTKLLDRKIQKVAICGGSGSFLLRNAKAAKADVFITGDFKYHEFFDAEDQIVIADIGHYESEQFTKDLIYEILSKKFPNIAVHLSEVVTNPVNYFYS